MPRALRRPASAQQRGMELTDWLLHPAQRKASSANGQLGSGGGAAWRH